MKRFLFPLALLLLLVAIATPLCFAMPVAEKDAKNITRESEFVVSSSKSQLARLYDDNVRTGFRFSKDDTTRSVEINAPKGQTLGYLQMQWTEYPKNWSFEAFDGTTWHNMMADGHQKLSESFTLPQNTIQIKIIEKEFVFAPCEIALYTPGKLPEQVQVWNPPAEKADLLIFSPHPDDELIFMGGTIPYYGAQQGKTVQLVYMSNQNRRRAGELLDGLWVCKNSNYPILLGLEDKLTRTLPDAEKAWKPETTLGLVVEQIRRFQPDVIVTVDLKGEYGHGAHMLTAKLVQQAVEVAADPAQYTDSVDRYGTWQVKKLYLHLYPENKITMNWRIPLDAFAGQTGLEVAQKAYQKHVSQNELTGFTVTDKGKHSCAEFGLAFTTVGLDEKKDDFFEHIVKEELPKPTEQIAQTPDPRAMESEKASKTNVSNRTWLIISISVIVVALIALVSYFNNRRKKKTK